MMKTFKLLLTEIPNKDSFGYEDKDAIKLGEVAFPFKGKTDDYDFDLKKGDEVFYQYGTPVNLNGKDYQLVSLTSLICLK